MRGVWLACFGVRHLLDIAVVRGDQAVTINFLKCGDDPAKAGVDYLEEIARRLKDKFAALSIEVQPLEEDEYARLFKAGITAVAVYQETYDRTVYDQVHLAGKKCDYEQKGQFASYV